MLRRHLIRFAVLAGGSACLPFEDALAREAPYAPLLTLRHAVSVGGQLLFIGTQHTIDKNHPELAEMRMLIQQFKPDVALIEGGNWPIDLDPAELASRHGEMAFAKRVSSDAGAITQDADPPFDLEIRHVAEQFDIRLVKLFYVLRMVPQILRSNAGESAQRLQAWMTAPYLNVTPQMREVIRTEEELNATLHLFAPRFQSWRDAEDSMVVASTGRLSVLNEVARRSVRFREEHALAAVDVHMKQGRRVLLVMGRGHVEALEGSLKARLGT